MRYLYLFHALLVTYWNYIINSYNIYSQKNKTSLHCKWFLLQWPSEEEEGGGGEIWEGEEDGGKYESQEQNDGEVNGIVS